MASEPRNAASERYRSLLAKLSSRLADPSIIDEVPIDLTETFVKKDRRRLVALPDADRYEYLEHIKTWAMLGESTPVFNCAEVIDVAGDRLVLSRLSVEVEQAQTSDQLQLVLFDQFVERMQLIVAYDVEDRPDAILELRRLSADVEHGLI